MKGDDLFDYLNGLIHMKLWQKFKDWCRVESLIDDIELDIVLTDDVHHDPKYSIKKSKPMMKQTDHGFIEMPETKEKHV